MISPSTKLYSFIANKQLTFLRFLPLQRAPVAVFLTTYVAHSCSGLMESCFSPHSLTTVRDFEAEKDIEEKH